MRAFTLYMNPRHGTPGTVTLPAAGFRRAKAEITSWDGYAPTPLRELTMPGTVRFKDEAGRFGLGSFKVLGSAYAVVNLLADTLAQPAAATPRRRAVSPSPRPRTATTGARWHGLPRGSIADV
jgi:diaminopropionate ammonia-lyase